MQNVCEPSSPEAVVGSSGGGRQQWWAAVVVVIIISYATRPLATFLLLFTFIIVAPICTEISSLSTS